MQTIMKRRDRGVASCSSGFVGDGLLIGNVDTIEEKATAAAAAEEEEEAEGAGGEGEEEGENEEHEGEGERPANKSKLSWWDRDGAISKAEAKWMEWFQGQKTTIQAEMAKVATSLKSDFVNAPTVKSWAATCKQRLMALELVASTSETLGQLQEAVRGERGVVRGLVCQVRRGSLGCR